MYFFCETTHAKEMKLNKTAAEAWVKKGAQPTETVRSILKKNGILD